MFITTQLSEEARLHQARAEALYELRHLQEEIQGEIDVEADEGDEQITEHETAAILIAMLERKIQDIDRALDSLESGAYHSCARCGRQIEEERLIAKPDARYCIECQQAVEKSNAKITVRQCTDVPSYFFDTVF